MGVDLQPAAPPATLTRPRWAFRALDVHDEDAVSATIADAVERFGRLDGVVNAAGVAGGGPVHLLELDEWRRVIDVNLTGTFLVAKHAVTSMLAQERIGERERVDRHHREHRGPRGHRRRQRLQRLRRAASSS